MTIHIDKARALELLEQAVAERGPEYRYPLNDTCQYVYAEHEYVDAPAGAVGWKTTYAGPACIVGVVMHKAGVPLANLDVEGDVTDLAHRLRVNKVAVIDNDALEILSAAQLVQDEREESDGERNTWGSALEAAKEAAA